MRADGFGKFVEYSVISPAEIKAYGFRIVDNSVGLPWTTWVGGAGMSGELPLRRGPDSES